MKSSEGARWTPGTSPAKRIVSIPIVPDVSAGICRLRPRGTRLARRGRRLRGRRGGVLPHARLREADGRRQGLDGVSIPTLVDRFLADDVAPERRPPPPLVTGVHGGHDIDLRAFAARGMTLVGHVAGVRDGKLALAADLRVAPRRGRSRLRRFQGRGRHVRRATRRSTCRVGRPRIVPVKSLPRWRRTTSISTVPESARSCGRPATRPTSAG